jgi:hypothetical protein
MGIEDLHPKDITSIDGTMVTNPTLTSPHELSAIGQFFSFHVKYNLFFSS